jgi:hypothetical protein
MIAVGVIDQRGLCCQAEEEIKILATGNKEKCFKAIKENIRTWLADAAKFKWPTRINGEDFDPAADTLEDVLDSPNVEENIVLEVDTDDVYSSTFFNTYVVKNAPGAK